MDAQFWDELYGSREQLFSGNPNGVLVTEVTGMPAGRALDVGCGEGADACWLAERGWQVTAVDLSRTALDRAAALSSQVRWQQGDPTTTPPPAAAFDLVSLQYFPLPHEPDHTALRGLLAAVAEGGTLLVVGHDPADMPEVTDHGFAPAEHYQPGEIADLLGRSWTVQVLETRTRTAPAPEGSPHVHDVVLRARRG